MAKVCELIDETTLQCLEWVEFAPYLPALTISDAFIYGSSFWLVLAVSWGFKQLEIFIKSF